MKNTIKRTIGFLANLGNKAIAGMTLYVPQLTLPNSVTANLPGRLDAMTLADTDHKETIVQLKARQLALNGARQSGVAFTRIIREQLKPRLGQRYSQAWDATGLTGSLRVPEFESELLRVLYSMAAYLTTYPIADAGANATAAHASALHDALAAASAAVIQQKDAVDQAMKYRDEKAKAMEFALRILLSELHKTLTPLDSRWFAFGFKKPGARATPDVPLNLLAVLIGTNAISMKWDGAPRAEYYRVWKKVIGVDADYVSVGSPADLDFTIEGLPGNSQVEVVVSAVNNGGQSAWSTAVLVQTL
ncbi:MAG: fibronectin type III domain-containing protein [Verrucomicrobia bacterium]|nr:fibronectin type III domain-containing protein [Verrucomicrobiota bacterium]